MKGPEPWTRWVAPAAVTVIALGLSFGGAMSEAKTQEKKTVQLSPECQKLVERHKTEADKFSEPEKRKYLDCISPKFPEPEIDGPSRLVPVLEDKQKNWWEKVIEWIWA